MSVTSISLPEHWTSIRAIRKQLMSKWTSGQLLVELIQPADMFPLRLPLKTPSTREMGDYFSQTRHWIQQIETGILSSGFTLEWRQVNHRQLGRNHIPKAVIIPDLSSALRWLNKSKEGQCYVRLAEQLLNQFIQLKAWVIHYPHRLLATETILAKLMAVIAWRLDHPNPDIYLRQLSLPGIDTKFVEQHKKILSEWLDILLPQDQIQADFSSSRFAKRYLFVEKPTLIRFRLLDPDNYINGLSDLAIPSTDFAQLTLAVNTLFVIENDINALAFPAVPKAMVLFGRGYGFDYLKQIDWINQKRIIYWGDIDTHGFAILNQFRTYLPQTESMLMDINTLRKHQVHWSKENKQTHASLPNLTEEEQTLYQALQANEYGQQVRLEQEYIQYTMLLSILNDIQNLSSQSKSSS